MEQLGEGYAFRILGNLCFIGTVPASTHLLDTGNGLAVFDPGYPDCYPIIVRNMEKLGFSVSQVRWIFCTHGHIDHFGAAKALRQASGAKIFLGEHDLAAATGELPLSYAEELGMTFDETFMPDSLLSDGDIVTVGDISVKCVATPGHTAGAMSYFFPVTDNIDGKVYRAGLHGGMGINTLDYGYLTKHHLPFSLREDFFRAMDKIAEETVDIFLGNHLGHNETLKKYEQIKNGNRLAFVNPSEWILYCRWCKSNLQQLLNREANTVS